MEPDSQPEGRLHRGVSLLGWNLWLSSMAIVPESKSPSSTTQ
jgi:hypothetical protein